MHLDNFKLDINGERYAGWQSVTLRDGIKQAAAGFELQVTEKWQVGNATTQRWKIRAGDECRLYLEDDLLLTGWVDVHKASISKNQHSVSVSGRSKPADLVDCSAINSPGNWHKQSFRQIADSLCAPFGIEAIFTGDLGERIIPKFELENAESVFEALNRLAKKEQLLLTSTPLGQLLVTQSGQSRYKKPLQDVLEASVSADWSKRYSGYLAKAQMHGENFKDPLKAAQVNASVQDDQVSRYRPIIIRPEGSTDSASALRRIEWQRDNDIASSLNITAKLLGYRGPDGQPWRKNSLIYVEDNILDLAHWLLIDKIEMSKSNNGGSVTSLTLVHPDVFVEKPENQKKPQSTASNSYFDL